MLEIELSYHRANDGSNLNRFVLYIWGEGSCFSIKLYLQNNSSTSIYNTSYLCKLLNYKLLKTSICLDLVLLVTVLSALHK